MLERVVIYATNIGDYDAVQAVARLAGDDYLSAVLQHTEIRRIMPLSWAYWYYRHGLAAPDHVPAMPIGQV